jgi:hypothetical protein
MRDPRPFMDVDTGVYLFYTARGDAIGVARLTRAFILPIVRTRSAGGRARSVSGWQLGPIGAQCCAWCSDRA